MLRIITCAVFLALQCPVFAKSPDAIAIERAIFDYIESQHQVNPALMERALDRALAKRTYWQDKQGNEFVMETSYDYMIELAGRYNRDGSRFSASPRVEIDIFDIDQRVASAKLTVDDWIDYMHLYKTAEGQWKVLNVLWQMHDTRKQVSTK
ncbi:nuclear transport factor 2 family protein [Corallincola platygyrae]|uniref:Nuclear transport factor 2 family protein n=1 Tax=Corallincola platygyrae TaxID=1193278 RepID=A0ABW4XRY0_9GAMM